MIFYIINVKDSQAIYMRTEKRGSLPVEQLQRGLIPRKYESRSMLEAIP
jgi:hypothetical protein